MRILCFTDTALSVTNGGSLRRYNLLKGLAERDQLRILIFTAEENDPKPYGLDESGAQVNFTPYKARPRPLFGRLIGRAIVLLGIPSASTFRDRMLGMHMLEHIDDFLPDVILAMGNDLALNIPRSVKVPIVADLCDAQSLRSELTRGWWKKLNFKAGNAWMERMLSRKCKKCLFVSQRDADASSCAVGRTAVVPNGVDTHYFHPPEETPNPHHVAFVGVMSYPPNVAAVMHLWEDIWPLIRSRVRNAQCHVVGMDPPDPIRRLDGEQGFCVTGYVEDVRPYCWRSALAVLPIRCASGQQNKALQAMAMGMPVVTYPQVQEGIGAGEQNGMITVNNSNEFASEVVRLMQDDECRSRLSVAASEFVRSNYSWDRAISTLEYMLHITRR